MRVAVIGSRGLQVDHLENYLPEGVTEIVSGGAKGIDTCAKNYALLHGLKLTEFLPEYSRYGRGAPCKGTSPSSNMPTWYWPSGTESPAGRNL